MFFTTKDAIPEGMGFAAFGLTHILWLLAGLALWVAACISYRRLPDNKRTPARTALGLCILMLEIVKDTVLLFLGKFGWGHLPFHLCGINILLITFDVIRPTKVVRSFLYYFCIPGAMLALLFPDWTALPAWNFFHIHSFTIHILLVLYPLLLVTTGQVSTKLTDALRGTALLAAMAIPVYGLNLLLDTNFMFLAEPGSGNPLALFETLLGSHLWGFPILLPIVILVMYLPARILSRRKGVSEKQC